MKILEVKDLSYGYEDNLVLENFNMNVSSNEIVLLDGENGAGKTTLLKCICNIINNGKNIYINGEEVYNNKKFLSTFALL